MPKKKCERCKKEISETSLQSRAICGLCLLALKRRALHLREAGTTLKQMTAILRLRAEETLEILRSQGIFGLDWIKENIGSFSGLTCYRFPGVPENFNYPEKTAVRREMIKETRRWLGKPETLRYLCLPHVGMVCYYQFGQTFAIIPEESSAVEDNDFYFRHISSWVNSAEAIQNGESLKGLRLYQGKLSQALSEVEGTYDCANLDFQGPWTAEVRNSLLRLFREKRLAVPAALFITLNDDPRFRFRSNSCFTKPLCAIFPQIVWRLTKNTQYTCHYLWHLPFRSENGVPMFTIAFGVHNKERQKKAQTF